LSVALSRPPVPYRTGWVVRARAVAVSHHRALWSPDFPPPAYAGGDRQSGPRNSHYTREGLIITTDSDPLAQVRTRHALCFVAATGRPARRPSRRRGGRGEL